MVFQPFHRVNGDRPGSGLGLAIVKGIAEGHGGRAGVDNRPGEGATFWIEVPR
jgi:signal transduction histidine kinase